MKTLRLPLDKLPVLAAVGGAAAALASSPGDGIGAIMAAVFVAALASSVVGFAFSPICAVLLLMLPAIAEPARLIALLLVASITIQSICFWRLRRDVDWQATLPFLAGGLPTLPLGLMLALHTPMDRYQAALGFLLAAYAVWMLTKRPIATPRPTRLWQDVVAGAAGGVTGGVAAFPSAPVVAWLGLRGEAKVPARGITQSYILVMQLVALGLLHLLAPGHPWSGPGGAALLAVVPSAALGTLGGLALYARLSDLQYGRAVNLLLLASGVAMVALGR